MLLGLAAFYWFPVFLEWDLVSVEWRVRRSLSLCEVVLVEVGCGTGGNVSEFSFGYFCVGIDINQHAIDRAKELYLD